MDSAEFALQTRERWLQRYRFGLRIRERGTVTSIGDGIAWIRGLPSAAMEELLELDDGSHALVFHLAEEQLGAILLSHSDRLRAGMRARLTGRRLSIVVGDALLGRVVDPLGAALDGLTRIETGSLRQLEALSPPIGSREVVDQPLYTGNRIVDTMLPIGKGQRQLIIGDNGTGKSSLAIDTVVHQLGTGVLCVYVLIGQKRSTVVGTIETLRSTGALNESVVIAAEATATPGLKYLAPFAGCAVAEHWMTQGREVLVVYDDLTTHARAYRELALLLRRPPGREAYPGDIFYLHARLLERATRLSAAHGGGSMTALPIVETEQGEIAAYIPTNLISITDGQIYFDQRLFAAGFLPAIDVTRSVSRIGGKAQHPAIKREAGRMKLDYLQFIELEVFTRFGARLEASIEARIRQGRVLREILKQERLSPLPASAQIAWLVAFNDGLFDGLGPEAVRRRLALLIRSATAGAPELGADRDVWRSAIDGWLAAEEHQ